MHVSSSSTGSVYHYCEVGAVLNIVNKATFRATNLSSAIVVPGHTHPTPLIPQFRLPIFDLFTISVTSSKFPTLFEKMYKKYQICCPVSVTRWAKNRPLPSQRYRFVENSHSSILLKLG